jgi:hypothetical protein
MWKKASYLLVVIARLGTWLGHFGHSFRSSAEGFGIQGSQIGNGGAEAVDRR